jgi:hypothetical protein
MDRHIAPRGHDGRRIVKSGLKTRGQMNYEELIVNFAREMYRTSGQRGWVTFGVDDPTQGTPLLYTVPAVWPIPAPGPGDWEHAAELIRYLDSYDPATQAVLGATPGGGTKVP